jgi:microsomal dipeptidase-like Zn-dependent dipeptidase
MARPRRRWKKRVFIVVLLLLLFASGIFFFVLPALVEKHYNATTHAPPYHASPKAAALHRTLFVADLHADSLLWGRNLLERGTRGHVDVPRLREGNVALQVFTVVTKTPRGLNIERNDDRSDNITLLALANRWPPATWRSLKQRALYQAARLHRAVAASGGKVVLIKSSADLAGFVARRQADSQLVAAMLGIEGAHALDDDLQNLEELFDAGFRMMAPTHFFDTAFGGSSSGVAKGGLTAAGKELIKRMEAKGMTVDLAHASPQTIDEVLTLATKPVVISHTGVQGACHNNRNISDRQAQGIARTGGVVGIGFWQTATCGTDARAIARSIRYTANLIGTKHVGLGSDFDGAVAQPFDASGLAQITDALLAENFDEEEIKMIMGGNVLRVFMENLPR